MYVSLTPSACALGMVAKIVDASHCRVDWRAFDDYGMTVATLRLCMFSYPLKVYIAYSCIMKYANTVEQTYAHSQIGVTDLSVTGVSLSEPHINEKQL